MDLGRRKCGRALSTHCRRGAGGVLRFSLGIDDLAVSASTLFSFAQSALLWMREYDYRSRSVLLQIRATQDLAFEAAAARSTSRWAKHLQLEASAGEPLTVCVGEFGLRPLPDLRDVLDPHGDYPEHLIPTIDWNARLGTGCFAICADGTGLQRPSPPRRWCDSCRKSSSSRTAQRVTEVVQRWGERRCVVCRASFAPTRPDRWRCDDCLAGHRSLARTSFG